MKKASDFVTYNADDHTYTRIDTRKLLAGVSTVSGVMPKPWLAPWAAKECSQYINQNWQSGKTYTQAEIDKICTDGKTEHSKKTSDACDIGTEIHDIIERLIKGKKVMPTKNQDVNSAVRAFRKWEKESKVKWLHSELLVCNLDYDIAGRLDAVAEVDGKLTLIDFKTSNAIYDEYHLQTAGYCLCLKWMDLIVQRRAILRIPKTDIRKVWHDDIKKYTMEKNTLEYVPITTDINFDCETFLHCRETYRWMNQKILKNT